MSPCSCHCRTLGSHTPWLWVTNHSGKRDRALYQHLSHSCTAFLNFGTWPAQTWQITIPVIKCETMLYLCAWTKEPRTTSQVVGFFGFGVSHLILRSHILARTDSQGKKRVFVLPPRILFFCMYASNTDTERKVLAILEQGKPFKTELLNTA